MPDVDFDLTIAAPIDVVWRTVRDVDSYAGYMDNVLSASVTVPEVDGRRHSAWSILLKGAVLRWDELEEIDDEDRRMSFRQTDGDMESLEGFWTCGRPTTARCRSGCSSPSTSASRCWPTCSTPSPATRSTTTAAAC